MLNIKMGKDINHYKSSFYPKSLEGKSNYKIYYTINEDGSVKESVLLSILDARQREEVIFMHFIQNQQIVFGSGELGINILSRDKPRDFEIETSDGDIFNIEITSISNHQDMFRKLSNEERYTKLEYQEFTSMRELKKVESKFSNSKDLIAGISDDIGLDDRIENPFFKSHGRIYINKDDNQVSLLDGILQDCIKKKVNKRHKNKENTLLIIDNRTTKYEIKDVYSAISNIDDYLSLLPFKEVWFYTGFCCDMDGTNADFCMIPLKISKVNEIKMTKYLNSINS